MQKKILYTCECCGRDYLSLTEAEKCEKSHKAVVAIVGCQYRPYKENLEGYPVKIAVQMSDGRIAEYRR